ncbi:hypothetical protein BW733_07095 [Tessaracoccus flavescens]|uniref:SnoaL-like domain-containing protein n=2 Tax=Tessaracoccus flavescens TaxID=399497 RepID=A0A1Q2CWY7_9ACTN|nr:hypothetical protein BW733_07095 [Tessaracoccus flavescens]
MDTVASYGAAMATGDLEGVRAVLAEDAVWHQPGANVLRGPRRPGRDPCPPRPLHGAQRGPFALATDNVAPAGDLVVTTIRFSAQRPGVEPLDQHGADIFNVEDGLIRKIWLISEDQAAEDGFWNAA